MKSTVLSRRLTLLALLPLLTLSALADQIWKGTSNNQWPFPGNWSTSVPASGDFAIYNNLSLLNVSNWLGQDFSLEGVVVSNAPAPVSINSDVNTLTLTPPFLNPSNPPVAINMSNATHSLTLAAAVALGTNQSWYVTNGQTLSVPGVVSGGGGLYKDGLGTLFLSGANTFTNSFTNNGGAVWINNSQALGIAPTAGTKSIVVANNNVGAGLHLNGTNGSINIPSGLQFVLSENFGALFNEAGDNVINGNIYVTAGGSDAYLVANTGSLTLNGPVALNWTSRSYILGGAAIGTNNGAITENGNKLALRKVDAGSWTMNGNDQRTGNTTIEGGTLFLGPKAQLAKTASISVFTNATLDVSAMTNNFANDNAFYLSSGSTIQALQGSGTVNGNVLCATTAYIVPGGSNAVGTLTITTNLTLSSAAVIPFELNTATTAGSGFNDLVNVGGNLDPQGATLMITPLSQLPNGATYRLFNYGTASANPFNPTVATDTRYTFSVVDSATTPGHIDLTVTGGNSNLVWSGGAGSTWDVINSANWDSDTQQFYTADNVKFDDTSANNAVNISVPVRPLSVIASNNSAAYVFYGTGKITGNTGVTKQGSDFLTNLISACDFTGPVTVNGGTYVVTNVNNSGTASALGAGSNITLNGGTFLFAGGRPPVGTFNRSWTLGASGGTVESAIATFFIAGQISGVGSLTKTGSQQVILGDINTGVLSTGASNTYSGNTLITQGELQLRNNHALGTGKAVVSNGADLSFGGGVAYGTLTNNIDLNGGDGNGSAGALQVNDANTSVTYGGTINLLASSGVGSFSLPTSFTISGPIIGPGGLRKKNHITCTVILTNPTNSFAGGTLVEGGTLQLGNGGTAGTLGSGAVTNNGTLAYNHSDMTTNGSPISGTGTLTHTGTGTLVLSGASTYAAATTVSGGTLQVNGSLGTTAVTVQSGGTLGGYGTLAGPVTVQSGGTIALGATLGTLNINNTLSLSGTNVMKINKTGSTLTSDLIQGMTSLTYGGVLKVTATGDQLAPNDSFKLFNATSYGASNFSSTNLPALAAGLFWDTTGLTNNGTIKIGSSAPTISTFKVLASGNFQLTFSGPSGAAYHVWATTNVALKPVTNTWTSLTSGSFGASPVTFTDTQAPNFNKRFYLISMP